MDFVPYNLMKFHHGGQDLFKKRQKCKQIIWEITDLMSAS